MVVELLNTGIEAAIGRTDAIAVVGFEAAIDRVGPEWHSFSKNAKDVGSAAVLLSILLCCGIWFAALWHRFSG